MVVGHEWVMDVYGSSMELYLLISLVLWVFFTLLLRNPGAAAIVAGISGQVVCWAASQYGWGLVAGIPLGLVFLLIVSIYIKYYARW